MTVLEYTTFFQWWVIFASVLYVLTAVVAIRMPDFLYRVQGRMFDLKEETFKTVLYCYMGVFKVLFLLFVVTPYLALLMMG